MGDRVDLLDPSPLPPPPPPAPHRIDPRIRQRRIQVRREEGRRRLRVLIAATSALVVALMAVAVARSPLLGVRHIRVFGVVHVAPADVATAARLSTATPMLSVNPSAEAHRIEALPWVDTARVLREWPATVAITVTERVPVAMILPGPVMVDASGRVLGPPADGYVLPVVVVPGPAAGSTGPAPGPAGSQVDAVYAPGIAAAAALSPDLIARMESITVNPDASVTLLLQHGATAQLGSAVDLVDKIIAVDTILTQTQVGSGTIDVTVPSAPVVSPAA